VPEGRLTLGKALQEFGWFAVLFTVVIGGTSVLALLEQVFVEHRLIAAFQWIVDGYDRIIGVAAAVIEPLVLPIVDALNTWLNLDLRLGPHWRSLFVLGMLLVLGLARGAWRSGHRRDAALAVLVIGVGALAGALVSGLLPLAGGWWAQGLGAALPTIALFAFFGIAAALSGGEEKTPVGAAVLFVVIAGALAFVLGALLSLVPGLAAGAGVLSLALMIGLFGAGFLWNGLRNNDPGDAVLGLIVLGGFVSAGMVLIADLAVKALS
jgi:hypothetical protein